MSYLREESHDWRDLGPGLPPASNDVALRRMCDYGAQKFHAGKCDGLEFRIWATERDLVTAYMAEVHPSVPYQLRWPQAVPPKPEGPDEVEEQVRREPQANERTQSKDSSHD